MLKAFIDKTDSSTVENHLYELGLRIVNLIYLLIYAQFYSAEFVYIVLAVQ
jgi:hypothetical protein